MRFFRSGAAAAASILIWVLAGCGSPPKQSPGFNKVGNPEAIRKLIAPAANVPRQDGIAAAILLDTSGSMSDAVEGSDKKPKPKLRIAQDALINVARQFEAFGRKHPEKKVVLGIYDFSARPGQPSCRQIVKLGPPDPAAAQNLIRSMTPSGSTPIGDAMIVAKRDLGASGFSRQHILVITDGENNRGYLPGDVAKVISQEPEADRAGVYFIAFDVGADLFDAVRDAGGLVLSASSEQQLTDTLEYILTGKILVEQPVPPPSHPTMGTRK